MKRREIALYVILSIVTCGIFGLVWLAFAVNDLNELTQDKSKFGGGMIVFLSIITCGIFLLYWYYDAGKSIEKAKFMRNMPNDKAMSIVYMILGLFGFGIISMALIQNEINNMVYVMPVNDGTGFDCTYNTASQPYNQQNYYNDNKTYSDNGYNNYEQGYNQNNYNNYNNSNYANPEQGYNQNDTPDGTSN